MPFTWFEPAKHGFHFSNNHMKWEIGAIPFAAGTVLCGGMAYAAIDFWTHKLPIPPDSTAPPPGHPVNEYILTRQITAHGNTLPRYLLGFIPTPSVFSSNSNEYSILRSCLTKGSPIPLCLVGPGYGHHVVAYSCTDLGEKSIGIYDPNSPNRGGTVTLPAPNQVKNSLSQKNYHAMFVDIYYRPIKPNIVTGQGNWRWCTKCQGLFFNGQSRGVCPNGSVHQVGGVYHYTLQTQFGGDWKRCGFCEALFYSKGTSRCPVSGAHVAINDQLYNLALLAPGAEEQNWFQCMNCQGMFYGGYNAGVCPAGGGHRKGIPFTLSRTEFVMER